MIVSVTNEHFEGSKKVRREFVESLNMKEDHMAIFKFVERKRGGLKVNMASGMKIH